MKIFLICAAIFVAIDVLIVLYVIWRRMRRKILQKDIDEIQKVWKDIIRQKDMRHAIMDADKLLDHALYLYGYRGNLGNKLKKSATRFRNINHIWSAHKVRNNIAHQINYSVDEKTYRNTMIAFKNAFMDLKIF
jgi:hypothetical protein